MKEINILKDDEIDFFRKELLKIIHKIKRSLLNAEIENRVNSKVNGVQRLFLNEKFVVALSYSLYIFGYVLIRTAFRTSNTLTPFKSIDKVREEVRQNNYSKLNAEKNAKINEKNNNVLILKLIISKLTILEENINKSELDVLKFMQILNNVIQNHDSNGKYRFGESLILLIDILKKCGLLKEINLDDLSSYLKSFTTNVNIRNEVAVMYHNYFEKFGKKDFLTTTITK